MDERDIIHIGSKLRAVVDGGLMGDNDELLTSYNHVASQRQPSTELRTKSTYSLFGYSRSRQ